MGVFAAETETINYVSIGASNVNGYGLAGYFTDEAREEVDSAPLANKTNVKMSGNVYGYERSPEGSYPDLVADYLASQCDTVNHNQLAISSMRVEELRVLLDNTYDGDEYTEWRFTAGQNWFNNALPGGLNALRADYQAKIADADLVTIDIGANNFGVFLSRYIMSGVDNSISVSNISSEIGDTYATAKEYVLNLMAKQGISVGAEVEEIVELLTYALVGYCYNFDVVMEKIYALNPDVDIVVVSIQNLMEGKSIKVPGSEETIPFGELIGSLVNAANLYTAGISPYADKYTYVDVRKNGHVNFFADQLLSWDGTSALDSDIIDCFNIYDNDLYVEARLADAYSSNPAWADEGIRNRVLNAAYNTTAKIMKAGLEIDTFDFAGFAGANTGAIEGVLFENITDEIAASVEAEVTAILSGGESTYEFDANRIFEDAIFDSNGIPSDLVKTVAGFGIYTGIGNSFFSHPSRAGHNEIYNAIVDAIENGTKGKDVIADEIDILIREFNELIEKYGPEAVERIYNYLESEGYIAALKIAVAELKATIDGVIVDIENPDSDLSQNIVAETDKLLAILEVEIGEELPSGEEVIYAIRNYEETLANIKDYLENNEEFIEAVASIEAIVAQINDIIDNPEIYIQNIIEDVVDKYEESLEAATTADYVACGDNHYVAFAGTNTYGEKDYEYSFMFSDYIDETAASTHHFIDGIPMADVVDYIVNLDAEGMSDLEDATIVTYQTDAKNIVLPLFDGDNVTDEDWASLLDVDAEKAAEIKATIIAALKGEYADEGAAALNDGVNTALEIKEEAMSKLPADWATALAAEGAKADEVIETILETAYDIVSYSLDATIVDMVAPLAEELVFNTVAYLVNNINAVETIKAINPNALIAVVGLHNPVKGLMVSVDGQVIDLGEYVEYFVEATNVYNTVYAAASENVIFVEADETEIVGYEGTINIDTANIVPLMMALGGKLNAGTVVTENGHNYIANQLKTAITKVNHIDSDNDDICDKCGENLAPVVPTPDPTPTPGPSYGGGGSATSMLTIKFETNGGSAVANVKVVYGDVLVAPANPTKDGFVFDGWYTDKELTNKYDFSQKVTKSFTLYAKWAVKNPFIDVNKDDWFYDAVMFVYMNGITKGVSETEYAPQGKVTRGQFITMLCRAYKVEEMSGDNFADCGSTWYTGYLAAAKQLGISNGVGDNMFAPEKEITREEMVTLIYNYLKSINKVTEETAELSFADSDSVSEWAKTAVAYAAKNGIVSGKGNNIFDPNGTATRAELAQIFYNMFK